MGDKFTVFKDRTRATPNWLIICPIRHGDGTKVCENPQLGINWPDGWETQETALRVLLAHIREHRKKAEEELRLNAEVLWPDDGVDEYQQYQDEVNARTKATYPLPKVTISDPTPPIRWSLPEDMIPHQVNIPLNALFYTPDGKCWVMSSTTEHLRGDFDVQLREWPTP